MSVVKTKKTAKPRWQITLPKDEGVNKRVDSLMKKYEGMNLSEIVKLALIKLDNEQVTKYDELLDSYYSGKNQVSVAKNSEELDKLFEANNS